MLGGVWIIGDKLDFDILADGKCITIFYRVSEFWDVVRTAVYRSIWINGMLDVHQYGITHEHQYSLIVRTNSLLPPE
jgi:hypothetical protein